MTHRPVTLLFALLILGGFAYQAYIAIDCCVQRPLDMFTALSDNEVLVRSGGAVTSMDHDRQFWPLLTSMFLHAGLIHLAANLIGLIQLGGLLEDLFGSLLVLLSFLVGGLLAGFMTLTLTNEAGIIYVGASGGIFSLAGTLLIASRRVWRTERATWSRRLSSRLIGCVAANIVLGIGATAVASWTNLGFGIANLAHVTGLFTGILIGLLPTPLRVNERTEQIFRWFDPPPPPEQPNLP